MSEPPTRLVFVSADRLGKPKKADRGLIRSHCMRGRNKRTDVAVAAAEDLSLRGITSIPLQLQPQLSYSTLQLERSTSWPIEKGRIESEEVVDDNTAPPLPSRCLVDFADEVDSASSGLILTVFPGAMRAFSLSGFGLPANLRSSQWRDWLFLDAAYVHSMISMCSVIQDFLLQRERSRMTSFHLRKSIAFLNGNLSDTSRSLSDVTIGVVISLTVASVISGDYAAMSAHAAGLRDIIRLRGGLSSFHHNPQLPVVLARVDLCLTLGSGQAPIIATAGQVAAPFDLANSYLGQEYPSPHSGQSLDDLVDCRLAAVFRNLQRLARRMNDAASSSYHDMHESDLHAGIWAAQYQLFQLQGAIHNVFGECLRMAMLAFLTTTFRVLGVRIKYEYAANQFRHLCCAIESSTQRPRHLMFWVLMIGTIAFFDEEQPWLRERWRSDVLPLTQGLEWTDARRQLQDYIWINACNDVHGKLIYEKMRLTLEED